MRPPEPLIKLGAALTGVVKGLAAGIGRLVARIRPPAGGSAAPRVSALRVALGRAPRPLLIAGLAAIGLGLALAAIAALGVSGGRGSAAPARAGSGYEFFEELSLPPPAPGELPFPLARPKKLRYTEADVAALGPQTWRFDVEALRARRVAELESLYETLP